MKLVHPEVGFQILWEENKIPVCIIEAPNRWRVFQKEFRAQSLGEDGKWILSEDDKIMDWKKNVEMIFNPIVLDENQRKIMTSFLSNLEKQIINEKYWKKGQELNGVIQQFFGELETEFPFDFSIDGEIEL